MARKQDFPGRNTKNTKDDDTMNDNRCPSLSLVTLGLIALLVFGPWPGVAQAQDLPAEVLRYADMVLYNGQILTMDRDQPPITVTEAVAVRDGRILAVGENDRILRMAGPDTERVDLAGKTVTPGFVDTHSHPNSYALRHYRDEYTPLYLKALEDNHVHFARIRWDSVETAQADFKRFAEDLPPGEWIYTTSMLNPTVMRELRRDDLDEAVPDHPLYIMIGNAMRGLANTKMLDIIVERYGDNLPGIVRDDQGVATGFMFGAAGTVIDQEVIPQTPPEVLAPFFKRELEEWVAIGVTTLSTRLRGNEISAYGMLERDGELPLRLGYSHEIGRGNPFLERDLKRLGNLQGHGTDRMWMIGISIGIPDGNGPGGAPGLWSGSTCTTPDKRIVLADDYYPDGLCFWDLPGDPGADSVLVANRYGYRISGVHTFGDQGFMKLLDAYEEADQERSIQGQRFGLDHGLMVSPEVVEKSVQLGVTWSLQPPLAYSRYAAGISRVYGEEYAHRWVLPVKSLIDAGARVTYGADTHNDPERHPLFNLEVVVTRISEDGIVYGPRERIDRSTGLLMLTRWGAEYVMREDELGSIEPGKLADLVVVDQNPLSSDIADEDLSEIKVIATLIGGEVAYGSLSSEP